MLKLQKPKVVVGKLIRKLQTKPSLMPWDRTLDVHIWSFVVVVESAVAIVAVVAAVVEAAIVVVEDIVVEESAVNVNNVFSFSLLRSICNVCNMYPKTRLPVAVVVG